jgi:hypothetical protein
MRFFGVTLAGTGGRAAVVEVAEVLEEVVVAVAIAGPFPKRSLRASYESIGRSSPV